MKTPPQVKGSWIAGHYSQFKKDPLSLLLSSSENLGDIFTLKAFNKPIIFVNSPELIEYVTQTNYTNYIKTPATPLRLILGDSIFTTDGEEWLKRRRMYQPALNNTAIKSYVEAVKESSDEMLAEIEAQTNVTKELNISKLMTNVTINVLGKTLFSTTLDLQKGFFDDIAVILEWIGERRLRHPFVVPVKWPTSSNKRFLAAVKNMDKVIFGIIEKKQAESIASNDLLSKFMSHSEDGRQKLNAKELRDEVMTIFLAGHETSANVLNWTFYLLAQHKGIQSKVRAEIDRLGNKELVYEDLHQLTYTTQVLNEVMRLYPPVWHFGRVNVADDEIGGFYIPAGTSVRISPFAIQRNRRFWKNPDQFDPDRFEASQEILPFTHIPFGAGPRLCAGRNFAMMEMIFIVVKLLKNYELGYAKKPVEMAPMITLRSKGDIILDCKSRK